MIKLTGDFELDLEYYLGSHTSTSGGTVWAYGPDERKYVVLATYPMEIYSQLRRGRSVMAHRYENRDA